MSTMYLQLSAIDPIVARDSRPFGVGQGNRMKIVPWPYPSVVAGACRTALVKASPERDFSGGSPAALLRFRVAGVFPSATGDTLYLPAPYDCVLHPDRGPLQASPHRCEEGGCDWPVDGLSPVMLDDADVRTEFKPKEAPAWWPIDRLATWLTAGKLPGFDESFLTEATQQARDHVELDPEVGSARESRLYTTCGLCLSHLRRFGVRDRRGSTKAAHAEITLAARVEAEADLPGIDQLHPLGGEGRLVHWRSNGNTACWTCPAEVKVALARPSRIRMVLSTAAVFAHGWRPRWIDDKLEATPPGTNLKLRLVGVCISRWRAVSGWSLAEPRGPKPIKRVVPAGGVYFFDKTEDPSPLVDRWLQPVSDDPQDCNDGFGLAIWGTW